MFQYGRRSRVNNDIDPEAKSSTDNTRPFRYQLADVKQEMEEDFHLLHEDLCDDYKGSYIDCETDMPPAKIPKLLSPLVGVLFVLIVG